jgi:spore coat-associated protein N
MSAMTALRRNPKRRLGALSVLALSGAVVVGSGANFSSASANPANTFATGTLTQVNSKDSAAILTASNLMPSQSATGTVDIQNTGSASAPFTLAKSSVTDSDATNKLSAKLTLVVKDCGLWSGGNAPSCAAPTQVYSGTIASMGTLALGSYAASDKRRYEFDVTFPDGGSAGADNAYQGDNMSVRFDWTATA